MKMFRFIILFFSLSGLFCNASYAANGYTLNVNQTRLVLSAKQPVTQITLTNPNETPMLIQVCVFHWTKLQGKYRYHPTSVILVAPSAFELQAHEKQTIRFALKHKIPTRTEQIYRVYLKAMISQTQSSAHINSQLKVALNMNIPLFVYPDVVSRTFVWKAKWLDSQHLQLQLHNTGNVTLFTHQWQLLSANKPVSHKQIVLSSISPDQSQYWTIKVRRQMKLPLSIRANINGQSVRTHVQVF